MSVRPPVWPTASTPLRDAVGLSVGIPKRQADRTEGPKDDLDNLMDALDALDL